MPVSNSIPDEDRYSDFNPVTETTNFPVGFVLFSGDAEEAKDEIEVTIDGAVVDPGDYSIEGTFDLTTDYPVCLDAEVVLPVGVTDVHLEIEGKKHVERVTQLPTGQGVAPHYWNIILNRIYAIMRETKQRLNRVPMMPYGEDPPTVAEMLAWRDYIIAPGEVISVQGRDGAVVITATDVGLGNVPNYPVASEAEAEAGVATDKFLTPERGAQLVAALAPSATYAPGFLHGLAISNSLVDVTNDLVVAAGKCRSGDDDADMVLAAALTKRLDAAWVVGTNQGGLDTGSKAVSTWYHIWLIKRTDGSAVDALFSLSATAPTMPSNYTYKRRIGAVRTTTGGAITAFKQYGDEFRFNAIPLDVDVSDSSTTAALRTLTVPPNTTAIILAYQAKGGTAIGHLFTAVAETDEVANISSRVSLVNAAGADGVAAGEFRIPADASSQIRTTATAASCVLRIRTRGWVDTRGRLA